MKTYIIYYKYRGETKYKYIRATSINEACNKSKIKRIIDIDIKEYQTKDDYLLRDF